MFVYNTLFVILFYVKISGILDTINVKIPDFLP